MIINDKDQELWQIFALREHLTEMQLRQFELYYELIADWNKRINLTRIIKLEDVLSYHFEDSLRVGAYISLQQIKSIADVGSGAGFPAIPLKIMYPHLFVLIIEVQQKKIHFLKEVIQRLALSNIEICSLDWRTFLRKTTYSIEYFCARASLSVEELLLFCKPSCFYRNASLVYWASEDWFRGGREKGELKNEYSYLVGKKKRKIVVFSCIECII